MTCGIRKFKGGKTERSTLKFSYLGEELNTAKLGKLVESHNSKNPPEYAVKVKGASNVEIPSTLMASFFVPLVENIKTKVFYYDLYRFANLLGQTIIPAS